MLCGELKVLLQVLCGLSGCCFRFSPYGFGSPRSPLRFLRARGGQPIMARNFLLCGYRTWRGHDRSADARQECKAACIMMRPYPDRTERVAAV